MTESDRIQLSNALWNAIRDVCCLSKRQANTVAMIHREDVYKAVEKLYGELRTDTVPDAIREGEIVPSGEKFE